MNSYAVQFVFHERITPIPPSSKDTIILDKAFTDEELTREEKDHIAQILWGTFGANSPHYKWLGWQWSMNQAKQMKRILVSFKYDKDTFRTYYAPDKTSLRQALSNVHEMIYANHEQEN